MTAVFAQDNYSQHLPRVQSAIEDMNLEEKTALQKKITTVMSKTDDIEMIEFLENVELMLITQELDTLFQEIQIDEQWEDTVEIPLYRELTAWEQREVKYEISKLQANLKDETLAMWEQIIASWNALSRYSETWNLTADLDMNIEDIFSVSAGMDISDYFAENQNFDSAIRADIEWFYNIDSLFEDNIELSGKTQLEFIQKWADSYLLMRDTQLSSNNESVEIELSPMIEKLTQLAQDNTYIAFSDEHSIDPLTIFWYFSQENIQGEVEKIFSQNLMQAYGKNETGYLLEPTKHFCDIGKNLMSVFDPFNGKQCSESQYENMLEDFRDSWVLITLNIANDTTLTISDMAAIDENEITHIELIWSNASFREMNMNIKDRSDNREYFNLQYIADDMLSIQVPKQDYDPEFYMDMKFGRNGGINNIDIRSSYEDEFIFTGSYNNGTLITNLDINIPEFTASCSAWGNAYINYLDITGWCDISSALIDTPSESLRVDSSLVYNGQASNNDFSWNIDAISDANNYMNFSIESQAQRQATGTYEIPAPTNTINYLDFLIEVTPEDDYYYDYADEEDYEYEYNSYEEYDEACYLYESGDRECYKYYDDKNITCEYIAETDEETCETYEYDDYEYYYDEE